MSEQMLDTAAVAAEEADAQNQAPAAAGAEEQAEKQAMPPEERAHNAALRRAAQEHGRTLRESAKEQALKEQVLEHPLVREAVQLLEQTRFRKDLDRVREAYPELTAKDPKEVGEVYCRLMASGLIDPVVAYEAQKATDRRQNPLPGDMVSAKSAGGAEHYFSSRELDRLTEQDLKDPRVFQKALSSLSKLRR